MNGPGWARSLCPTISGATMTTDSSRRRVLFGQVFIEGLLIGVGGGCPIWSSPDSLGPGSSCLDTSLYLLTRLSRSIDSRFG